MKKEYIIIGIALLFAAYVFFISPTKDKDKEEAVSRDREQQIIGGDTPTISETEARNLCRKINEGLGYWNIWYQFAGDNALYTPLLAVWNLIKDNKANTVLIIKAWRFLYGSGEYPNLQDAINSEYLLPGSPTKELRANVVNYLSNFPI